MKNHFRLLVMLILGALQACDSENYKWELKSPDGQISVVVSSISSGRKNSHITWHMDMLKDGKMHPVIFESPLGLELQDGNFFNDLNYLKVLYTENITTGYQLLSGKKLKCENSCNELMIKFINPDKVAIRIFFRAFNDGVAFCYEFPDGYNKTVTVTDEKTGFFIPGAKAWMHPYDTVTMYTPAYETYYEGPMRSGTRPPEQKNGWAFPALFETADKQWILLSESGMDGNYSGSHLKVADTAGLYTIAGPAKEEAMGYYDATSSAKLPFQTPWRVIIAGNDPGKIIRSTLITDLAEPCKLRDTSWIKPGRASWSWWYDHNSPMDYKKMLPYIDYASQMGWEYFLVDANWNKMKNGDLGKLAEYARSKGVGLLLWYNSGGRHNIVQEQPRDLMDNRDVRRKELQRISELGIKGVKVDFFQSDKQEMIKKYIDIIEDCADFHILVNFHGCTIPRGWTRTYPNLISTEAVRGAESYSFDPLYPEKAPEHLTILAFSRGVIGPMDYTPGTFSDNMFPHLTSNGFEIALPVILESGITHFADSPAIYAKMPSFVTEFLKNIPVIWDEIQYLDGYPGKYIVLARRHGDTWYLAGINSQRKTQRVKIDISAVTGNKNISIITEGKNARTLAKKNVEVIEGFAELHLAPLGGFVSVVK